MNVYQIEKRFRQRNIAHCLSVMFPAELGTQYLSTIAVEIQRLAKLLKTCFKQEFNELDFILLEAEKYSKTEANSLSEVTANIKKDKIVGKHYFPAFICSELKYTSYDQAQFEQYKALTFISTVRLLMMGEHKSAAKNVCDEIRQFTYGKRDELAAWLPNILIKNLPELINELDVLRTQALEDEQTKKIGAQLSKLYVPYHDSYKLNPGITRNVGTREFIKYGVLSSSSQQRLDDGIEAVVELNEHSSSGDSWKQEENNSGHTRNIGIITLDNSSTANYASRAIQAKSINNRILKKKMSLTCDIYQASIFEIKSLIVECLSALKTIDSSTAKLLLLMLLFGHKSEQIKKLKTVKFNNRIAGITRKHILPSQKQRTELAKLINNIEQKFTIPIPEIFCNDLKTLNFNDVNEEKIKTFIKQVNEKHNTNITQTKISSFLEHIMIKESIDPVFIELIKGSKPNDLAALSYTQIDLNKLIDIFERYLTYLGRISDSQDFNINRRVITEKLIGSPLSIDKDLLKSLFSELMFDLQADSKNNEKWFSEKYHNLVSIHVQLILSLSSGYRPVTGWLGKISDINLDTGEYWISDKENRLGDASRVVILPQLTRNIVKQYCAFMSRSANHYRNTNPQLSLHYQRAVNGEEHLFFYRDNQAWEESRPKTIIKQFDTVFPLQPNWHRHHIRTLLHNTDVAPDLIAAWMGHADIGQGPFTQYSSMSIMELNSISLVISDYLSDIDIKVINYGE